MKDLNIKECVKLINNEKNLLLLDVRTPEEFEIDGHIKDTTLLPLAKLIFNLDTLEGYEDSPILVYCRRGSRSLQACEILEDNGFNNLYNMVGGYSKWTTEGADKYLIKK
ncbi:MAG: rhodanese-like domain-containing protein [Sarcina sp.]